MGRPGEAGPLGAWRVGDERWEFRVWAPTVPELGLEVRRQRDGGRAERIALQRDGETFRTTVDGLADGDRYLYVFQDGRRRPDPRSRRQPEGVHGTSALVDPSRFAKRPLTRPIPMADWVIYELHVGTFTPAGTFDAVVGQLDYLRDELGVTAIEVMPVSPFPGTRNWGYDGAHPFAVQESYGGPAGLARLVAAAHERGLAVVLDVVYNHLGPEGNYLRDFGPYFTHKHETPWGDALNFDDDGAHGVRAYFRDNATQWIRDYDVDALRLDAVQMIQDSSPVHVVAEITEAVQAIGGAVIAESDMNDPVTVRPRSEGGWGDDAQWSDDLHHALHTILAGERTGYYEDYGKASDVATALRRGFVYDGTRYSSFRGKSYGKSIAGFGPERHVVCMQNHDQVGNRAQGDRFAALAGLPCAKVGAAAVLLSPGIPLLFMGEEYAAAQPFPFFTSHTDPGLARAVTDGRRHEFAAFDWAGEVPDPQDEDTFRRAVLRLEDRREPPYAQMLEWYRELLALRRSHPAMRGARRGDRTAVRAYDDRQALTMERWAEGGGQRLLLVLGFGREPRRLEAAVTQGPWRLLLDSGDPRFGGDGSRAPGELRVGEASTAGLELAPHCAWIFVSAV
ncbi:MAG TPA: malto-oligosyltrehalose trehalohydrolase [Vulgatibacter sp.]